jgi:hypothetical protein
MSTLQELIRQRSGEAPPVQSEHTVKIPAPSLQIVASDGEDWGFPWSHLIYVRRVESGDREVVSIVFVSHEVAVFGRRLKSLAKDISHLRTDELRPSKKPYEITINTDRWIDMIEVLFRTDQQGAERSNTAPQSLPGTVQGASSETDHTCL